MQGKSYWSALTKYWAMQVTQEDNVPNHPPIEILGFGKETRSGRCATGLLAGCLGFWVNFKLCGGAVKTNIKFEEKVSLTQN
jgi:hypothetical protein